MKQRMSVAPQKESLPNFINFQQMVDRNNSLIPQSKLHKKTDQIEVFSSVFQAPTNNSRKGSKILRNDSQQMKMPQLQIKDDTSKIIPALNMIPIAIPVNLNLNQGLVKQRTRLNAVYEKKLVEKSNFKNYKMGQEIDSHMPLTCGDKRVGSFGNYSIQESNKKQKIGELQT